MREEARARRWHALGWNEACAHAFGSPGIDWPIKVQGLEQGCARADAGACRQLGIVLERGCGRPPEAPRAGVAFETACELGEVTSCFELAHDGDAASREPFARRAVDLLEHGCSNGDLAKCEWLARELPRPTVTTLPVRQLTLLRTACEGGRPTACTSWSRALELGWYGPANRSEAVAVLLDHCGTAHLSCDGLAELADRIERGLPTPADPDEAERLFRIACERQVPSACHRWKALAAEPTLR